MLHADLKRMHEICKRLGVGRRPINDPFFDESYEVCKVFHRKGITVEDDEESFHKMYNEFPCIVAGCSAIFNTLLEYQMHYNGYHRYVCSTCNTSRPNPRLLDIHIQEKHDSYFQAASCSKPMYQCFVSDCDEKFLHPKERRQHCMEIHKYPRNFRFDDFPQQETGIIESEKMEVDNAVGKPRKGKNKKVVLNKNQKVKMFVPSMKTCPATPKDDDKTNVPGPAPQTASTSSSLMFVPRQVQKSYAKSLTKNQNAERNVLESETMMDLAESLP